MITTNNRSLQQWAALFAVALGIFCVQLDAFALNVALPRIGDSLGVSVGRLSWVVSAYLLAAGTLMLGAGRLGDLLGRRKLLLAGLGMFGAASLGCALASSLTSLVAARVVQGAGGALIMPVGLALVTNTFPPETRGRALGCAVGIGGVATACAPFVGGLLTQVLSWRAVFWLNVPLTALAMLAAYRAQESRDTDTPGGLDWAGLVAGTAAVAAVAVLVDRGEQWGWTSSASAAVLLAFLLLLAFFVRHERVARNPLVDLALFRNAPYVVLTTAGAVANTATVVFLFVVPLSLQQLWGLSVAATGVAFLAPAAVIAATGPAAGRIPPSRAVAVMTACLGAAAAALCLVVLTSTLETYLLTVTTCGVALGLANALTLTATQQVIRPERAGEASGITKTVITAAAGLGMVVVAPETPQAPQLVTQAAANTALTSTGLGCLIASLLLGIWTWTRRRTIEGTTRTTNGGAPPTAG